MKLLKKRILYGMIDKEINQRQLSQCVGLAPMTISKIMNGNNTTYDTAKKIANVLDIDVFELIDKEES